VRTSGRLHRLRDEAPVAESESARRPGGDTGEGREGATGARGGSRLRLTHGNGDDWDGAVRTRHRAGPSCLTEREKGEPGPVEVGPRRRSHRVIRPNVRISGPEWSS
jgi:hypothetical protein